MNAVSERPGFSEVGSGRLAAADAPSASEKAWIVLLHDLFKRQKDVTRAKPHCGDFSVSFSRRRRIRRASNRKAKQLAALRHHHSEAMLCDSQVDRIQLEFYRNDAFPREANSEIQDDRYFLLVPLRRSSGRVVSDGTVLFDGEVRPGMMRLASPGERVQVLATSPSRHLKLTIPGVQMRRFLESLEYRRNGSKCYVDPLSEPDPQVVQLSNAAMATAAFDGKQQQLYVDGLASSLIACLMGGSSGKHRAAAKRLSGLELERCAEYAEAMLPNKLDLSEWAGTLGMDKTEFSRRFRGTTREAPYSWFLNRRIERAMQMLQDRKASLAEIAYSVGFCSQSHFTEAFRRRVGCAPAQWREQR